MKYCTSFFFFTLLVTAPLLLKAQPQKNSSAQIYQLKQQAELQMESGKFGEAIELLNRYISANPQQADGYILRGICREKRKQYEHAVYDFRSAKKLEPYDREINSFLKRTTDAWYTLLYNKIEGHKREIAVEPANPENYLEIGKLYKNLGEWLTAEEWYDKYLTMEEPSADELLRYTEILAKNNHISKGEPLLKEYVKKYPDDHRLWSRLGYYELWLGKKRSAIESFKEALKFRPYFKEAQDGLSIALGKGAVYTLNDTSSYSRSSGTVRQQGRTYPIDRYFNILRRNPSDVKTRYLLIDELLKVSRIEEAYNQLMILEKTEANTPQFTAVKENVLSIRKNFYEKEREKYLERIKENPGDREAAIHLARYYSTEGEFDKAVKILENYLEFNPRDDELRFMLVQNASWDTDYYKAKKELTTLLNENPDKTEYQLLYAQLSLWLFEDPDKAEELLKKVLEKENDNIEALISLASLKLQNNLFADSEYYINQAENLNPQHPEVERLKYLLQTREKLNRETELLGILEKARKEVVNKNCSEAIKLFREYFAKTTPDNRIYLELANAYVCLGDYNSAISVYDTLLNREYSYEWDKERAKLYYYGSDSLSALREFKRLVEVNPDDTEAKLFLGDSYFKLGQFANARRVYNQLLESSPGSYIFKDRISWLGADGGVFTFPSYILASPEAIYFNDNLGFNYSSQGLRMDFGITDFLSIGGSASRGNLSSDTTSERFNSFSGNLQLTFRQIITLSGSYGRSIFENSDDKNIMRFSLNAAVSNLYSVTAEYSSMDAAQMLYSPFLVNERLKTDAFLFTAAYYAPSGIRLSGRFNYIDVSDNNHGDNLMLRLGKEFEKNFTAGYEYEHINYDTVSVLYYSPRNYETHSLWGDFNLINEQDARLTIGGKIGVLTTSDFVIKEIYGETNYKLIERLFLIGRIGAGSSVRGETTYSSFSFDVRLSWNIL